MGSNGCGSYSLDSGSLGTTGGCIVEVEGIAETVGVDSTLVTVSTGGTAGSGVLGAGTIVAETGGAPALDSTDTGRIVAETGGAHALGSTDTGITGISIGNGWASDVAVVTVGTTSVVVDTGGTTVVVAISIVTKSAAAAGVQSEILTADGE